MRIKQIEYIEKLIKLSKDVESVKKLMLEGDGIDNDTEFYQELFSHRSDRLKRTVKNLEVKFKNELEANEELKRRCPICTHNDGRFQLDELCEECF